MGDLANDVREVIGRGWAPFSSEVYPTRFTRRLNSSVKTTLSLLHCQQLLLLFYIELFTSFEMGRKRARNEQKIDLGPRSSPRKKGSVIKSPRRGRILRDCEIFEGIVSQP